MRPRLPVADAPHRRQVGTEIATRTQRLHLVEKAMRQHRVEAFLDAPMQSRAVLRQQCDHGQRELGAVLCNVQARHRHAGHLEHLECALDTLAVVRLQACRGVRIDTGEACVHRRPTVLRAFGFEARAQLRVGRRQIGQALAQRLRIEHRAPHHQRQRAAGANGGDDRGRVGDEIGGRVRLGRITDVDQVMGDGGALGARRLCGPDVHFPVHLRRIDRHDLEPALVGQSHREGALAAGGRTEQEDGVSHGAQRRRIGARG